MMLTSGVDAREVTDDRSHRIFGFRLPRAKAFYEKALSPLGYVLIMEVQQDENDAPAAGSAPMASRISGSAAKAD